MPWINIPAAASKALASYSDFFMYEHLKMKTGSTESYSPVFVSVRHDLECTARAFPS